MFPVDREQKKYVNSLLTLSTEVKYHFFQIILTLFHVIKRIYVRRAPKYLVVINVFLNVYALASEVLKIMHHNRHFFFNRKFHSKKPNGTNMK